MSNSQKSGTKDLIFNLRSSISALQVREAHLFKTLQNLCKHHIVAEHDRGPNNYSVRICTECTLKERTWVDEAGFCNNGYEKLSDAKGRDIKRVSAAAIVEYETLKPDSPLSAPDGVAQVMRQAMVLAQSQHGNYKNEPRG